MRECPWVPRRKIKPLHVDSPTFGTRILIIDVGKFAEGLIEAVGKPVLKGNIDNYNGSWMHDAFSHIMSDKLYVTRNNIHDMSHIYEYNSKSKGHHKNESGVEIPLPRPFQVGNLKILKKRQISLSLFLILYLRNFWRSIKIYIKW